jgi:putative Mn2+ efflux pump MntP
VLEVIILAIALSMDAFAVSIGLGAKHSCNTLWLALIAGIYFGASQALMPLLGYAGGRSVLGWIEAYAPWMAFFLLAGIGAKMIYEAFADDLDEEIPSVSQHALLMLAIATSIDAMAAGFTLNLLAVNPIVACAIIGVTTFAFSCAGVYIGDKSGTMLESKAEFSGGLILILVGFRVLIS